MRFKSSARALEKKHLRTSGCWWLGFRVFLAVWGLWGFGGLLAQSSGFFDHFSGFILGFWWV